MSKNKNNFLIKKVQHLKHAVKETKTCIILNIKVDNNYYIVINQSDDSMNPVFVSSEAYNQIGIEMISSIIDRKYKEYKQNIENIKLSPFYKR